jgi:putative protease
MQVFARGQDIEHGGLTPGFLEGPQHQRLVRGRNPRHRGVFVGEGAVAAVHCVLATCVYRTCN